MNPQITDSYSNKHYHFASFESIKDLQEQGQKAVEENSTNSSFLSEWGRNGRGVQDYDEEFVGTSRSEAEAGNFIEYINRDNLETAITSFDELLTKVDMGGAFEKSKLIITADSRGVFDFSLASKGLYRLREYYSEELKNESPKEFFPGLPGVVPLDNVYQDALEQFWYTNEASGKKYLLTARQKGTTYMLEINPDAKIVVDEQGLEYTDPISFNDFTLEFATTTKKSYIMFEKKGGKAKFVDLFVGIGGLATLTYEGMLARSLPLLLAARYFEQVGIRTRILATRMYKENDNYIAATYPIKDYGQDIDFNWIAINTSDPRWFRWNLWKYTSALSYTDKFQNANSMGYGNTVYGGDELLEVFNRYKNWYFNEMKKGSLKETEIDRNLMIAGGLPKPEDDDLTSRSGKEKIVKEFYRVLDIVDFQFNKPEKAAARIYKRFKEDEDYSYLSKNGLDQIVKEYIITTLKQAYSYPARGQHATEKERQDVLEEEFDKALEGTLNYLATI